MKNKDSNKNAYKTLLIITVLIFFMYALLSFSVGTITELSVFNIHVAILWMQFGVLLATVILLIILYYGALKGKVLAIPKKVNKYPVIRILLIALLASLFVVLGFYYCYFFIGLTESVGNCSLDVVLASFVYCMMMIEEVSITALHIFSFIFINLTIAWFIAKRQNRKQGEEESEEMKNL